MAGAQANIRNFYAPLDGPGRTAPTLIEDLTLYDPRHPPQHGRNILLDPPTHFVQTPELQDLLPPGSCRHEFRLQRRQSKLPGLDERPGPDSIYQVAAVCIRCRIHLILKVDYTVAWQNNPCPTHEYPLHHLVQSSWRRDAVIREVTAEDPDCVDDILVYECSSPSCSAIVTIRLSPPILFDEAVYVLTDPELVRKRTDAAFEEKRGHTEGMKRPTPLDVLLDLRAYIKNTWVSEPKTEINFSNKRFAVRFGPEGIPCKNVLELLRFTLKPGESWIVPKPDISESFPVEQPENIFLDNAEAELDALVLTRPKEELLAAQETTKPDPALFELARTLSCQNYDKSRIARTVHYEPALRKRAYTALGVPEDVSDDLIIFAYQQQMKAIQDDPRQSALFMTALEEIRRSRDSELLATQVGIERSVGRYGMETLQDAYRTFGLSVDDQADDQYIIGLFQSRVNDISPHQEQEMRQYLYIIGEHRGSREIKNFAQKSIETYEDALQFLGADPNTSDDFIRSLYTTKITDDISNTEMARKSIRFVADQRNSDQLKAFAAANFENTVAEPAMDVGEAYQILGIDDRTESDPDTLFGTYSVRIEDDPENTERLKRAIEVIAKHVNSPILNSYLGITEDSSFNQHTSREEPLGLENIGNTCYLNSLLQWLFTILPLRHIVLDFDEYKVDASDENLTKRKVGHRYISRREVDTAQKFARSLAGLFLQMITSSRTSIRPEIELARLTLETNFIKGGRRSSTLQSGRRPTLGTIDSRPILGPLPEAAGTENSEAEGPLLSPLPMETAEQQVGTSVFENELNPIAPGEKSEDVQMIQDADNSSEITLVSKPASEDYEQIEPVSKEQQQAILDNKENLSPVKERNNPTSIDLTSEKPQPLAPASPSKLNSQAGILDQKKADSTKDSKEIEDVPMIYAPPPGPPPSLPPRKPVPSSTTTLEEYARQQDVQEVMGHAVFQLSCAMRPKGLDKNGEQQDEIHDTFYGESKIYTVRDRPQAEEAQQFLSIQAGIFNEPKDVYAALDNEFDIARREDGSGAFQSITKLPPVLTISLGRVIFDEKARSQVKVNHHVDLPTTIYMDRYMDAPENSVLTMRRKQAWEYKSELRKLLDRKNQLEKSAPTPLSELFGHLKASLEHLQAASTSDPTLADLSVPMDCIEDAEILERKLRHEQQSITARIETLQRQIDDSFTDSAFRRMEYKLHAAFFHRGTVGSGHYWVYIKDHPNEIWRKYNDDRVTQVQDLREIFADPSKDTNNPNRGSPNANPYFLVYVQADHLAEGLIETVKREPIVEPEVTTNLDTFEEEVNIHPLGTEPPNEFAGQPSQMGELPPGSILNGGQPEMTMVDRNWTNNTKDPMTEEVPITLDQNIAESALQKKGDWDNSEATIHPSKFVR